MINPEETLNAINKIGEEAKKIRQEGVPLQHEIEDATILKMTLGIWLSIFLALLPALYLYAKVMAARNNP
jgi:hypothetical protein